MARYNREEHKQIIVRKQTKEILDVIKKDPEKFKIKAIMPLTYNAVIRHMLKQLYVDHDDIKKLVN